MHFRRSPSPAPPLSTIGIILDQNPEVPFRPDSIITGHVVFIPARDLPASQCQITFSGSSFTYIRKEDTSTSGTGSSQTRSTSYRHYRDRAPLFHFYGDLIQPGTPLVANQKYEWPLQFTFPRGTNVSLPSTYQDPNNEIWTTSPHELPPSFLHQQLKNHCLVEYVLSASVSAPNVAPAEAVLPLKFLPFTPAHIPISPQLHEARHQLASRFLADGELM